MNAQIIALNQNDVNAAACGSIVYWSLKGGTKVSTLVAALDKHGSAAIPPEEPSSVVALHRAVALVARERSGEAHMQGRGVWSIVSKAHVENIQGDMLGEVGRKVLAYPIQTTASLEGERIVTDDPQIAEAFYAALGVVTPQDMSAWLCKKLDKLGAVALRESGGFYFLPADVREKWEHLTAAVSEATSHVIHSLPALRSADAVDAILQAITNDATTTCDKIAADAANADLGRRALESRSMATDALLEKIERYESILGQRLESLRDATRATRAAVATAMLALGSEENA